MITLYTQENCMQCMMAKTMMTGEGIAYEEVYLDTEEKRNAFREKGYQSTPVCIKGDESVIGFHPEKIKELAQ